MYYLKDSQVGAEGDTPDVANRAVTPDGGVMVSLVRESPQCHYSHQHQMEKDSRCGQRDGGWARQGLMDHTVLRTMGINHFHFTVEDALEEGRF